MWGERDDSKWAVAKEFRTTHWSMVLAARSLESPEQQSALERLCRAYWYPLYAFARRRGHDPHQAQDLTQSFFARFLEKNYLAQVSSDKGRFRSFLLAAFQNFLANEWDRTQTLKRGGGARVISLDEQTAEERFQFDLIDDVTPEQLFEQRWVESVLEQVLARLRDECNSAGHEGRFDVLKVYLVDDRGAVPFAEMAARLGMTEASLKGLVRRLRQRYRELFREEIANTVSRPAEVDEEIRYLIEVLGRGR
jgi:RNA polymerase sigma factor (sigma-70 family)